MASVPIWMSRSPDRHRWCYTITNGGPPTHRRYFAPQAEPFPLRHVMSVIVISVSALNRIMVVAPGARRADGRHPARPVAHRRRFSRQRYPFDVPTAFIRPKRNTNRATSGDPTTRPPLRPVCAPQANRRRPALFP